MTIAVVWEEEGRLWCAADTRLVAGKLNAPTTEIGSKIYAIPIAVSAFGPDGWLRAPHFSTQYGFVYAGGALPALMTVATATTLLQKLARAGNRVSQPRFEDISQLIHRLAKRFILERRRFDSDGLFSAAFFGWCPEDRTYKVAHIEGRDTGDGWEVRLNFPTRPMADGEPWLVLGSAFSTFNTMLGSWTGPITKRVPRRVIEKMVAEESDPTVGGATSIGMAHEDGFELYFSLETIEAGSAKARAVFNGLDMQTEVGDVGEYFVAINGMA